MYYNLKDFPNQSIAVVEWLAKDEISTLKFKMSHGKIMRAGPLHDQMERYRFEPQDKVVQIDVTQHKSTKRVGQIVFYGQNGVLVKVGKDSAATGAKQVFKISPDEELICARLESSGKRTGDDDFRNKIGDCLAGVTFIKAKAI